MPHLKRLLAPSFWKISKKKTKWIVTPHAGPHQKLFSIPLSVLLKSSLNMVDTTSEAKKFIRGGEVFVDGKRRKDYAYPAGLFDVISIPKMKKHYRIIPTKKGLDILEITEKEANTKICRVNGKTLIRSGKTQLNLHDGKNVLVKDGNYKTGDSLLMELPSLKVVEHLPFEKGVIGIVSRGADAGKLAKVKDVIKGSMRDSQKVVCDINKENRIIGKQNFVVVGKEKPVIKLE